MEPFDPSQDKKTSGGQLINPVEPVDIPFNMNGNTDMYTLADEKAHEIIEAENQKLDALMAQLTKGFDPSSFGGEIRSSLPLLANHLVPGTYNHLLILLFETYSNIQTLQLKMEDWLRDRYNHVQNIHPSDAGFPTESVFTFEIEMLRNLLEPLRGGNSKPVFWLDARRVQDPDSVCKQLEESIKIIETFKNDVCLALKLGNNDRTIYSDPPAHGNLREQEERAKITSIKVLRLEACKATLSWEYFKGTEIEFTTFYKHYKAHISKNEPAKARASGWLPPTSPVTPRLSADVAEVGDPASWPSKIKNKVFDLLLKTALWLTMARGLPAVHLFCDMAKFFAIHAPARKTPDHRICLLMHITRFRTYVEGTQPIPSPQVPREVMTFPTRNPDYFSDVWKSGHGLVACLFEKDSLIRKNTPPSIKLSMPPRRVRDKESPALSSNPPSDICSGGVEHMQDDNFKNDGQAFQFL